MIQSFKDRDTEAVFEGLHPKGFPADLLRRARRKLQVLDAATDVMDLKDPPGNRLHQLAEDREGQWSISVNDQFRICFSWGPSGPENVEFVDYH
ncbi:MAG TPA: type II toxin-antitoxin system RelE/ParE family toxin [Phenylobacterium sp.]|nr:type II toxin-antitoxin system RelE/ParE family toxin [Phenylobacterium sp.]